MHAVLLIALLTLFASDASAQPCSGCGCRGGSGWQLTTTNSKKCIGCGEVDKRCGTPATKNCVFTGCPNIHLILVSCPQHISPGLCSLK